MLSESGLSTCGSLIGGTKLATIINTPTIRVERGLTASHRCAVSATVKQSERTTRIVSGYCEPVQNR